jgi:hypothetical protein
METIKITVRVTTAPLTRCLSAYFGKPSKVNPQNNFSPPVVEVKSTTGEGIMVVMVLIYGVVVLYYGVLFLYCFMLHSSSSPTFLLLYPTLSIYTTPTPPAPTPLPLAPTAAPPRT